MTPSISNQVAAAVLSVLVTLGAFAGVTGIATHQVSTTHAMLVVQSAPAKVANT